MEADEVAQPAAEGQDVVATLGIFLEEIAYFLDDMSQDVWWLLAFAHQPSGETFCRGCEDLQPVDAGVQACIDALRTRAEAHIETHGNQVRSKIIIVPAVTPKEREVLKALRGLRFHCHGAIEIFHCMKEANNAAIWAAYHGSIANQQPQWNVRADAPGSKAVFAQCVVVVPFYLDAAKQEIKLLNVWCPEKKKHWSFPSGDVRRGHDKNLYDAARREFHEEIGVFFSRDWAACFQAALPAVWNEDEELDERILLYNHLEKEGFRYPCRPHFLVQVSEEFYEATRHYEDAQGIIKLPMPQGEFVRWDAFHHTDNTDDIAARVHVNGAPFLEHDEARWVNLEFQTGKLSADDNRPVRRENADLFKTRPDKIWKFFAGLLGVPVPDKESAIPSDFPEDGPWAVRVSGIDKTASDDDIIQFFAEADVNAVEVRQFEVPKHTARVDFEDKESLEKALAMNNRMLLRRKVKVEIWTVMGADGAGLGNAPAPKPLKEYDGPLPDEGPHQCRVRGLDRTVTRDDLGYFFWDRDCAVLDVLFPLKSEKHAGFVEFKDQESLRRAMGLNNKKQRRKRRLLLPDNQEVATAARVKVKKAATVLVACEVAAVVAAMVAENASLRVVRNSAVSGPS
eukprot:TRINITY_DN15547_c0_g1_i3.p1 TRINITY_DN15547_c0_g1~~TRINITY_DN15547_c0_g1_i3.p1  ORF type:complete len:624 (+),score=140.08 TRINITY_DN15547_c0_g1_i3:119-1990(+)